MQRETRQHPAEAAGLDLFPATIIACGAPRDQAPRLLALQSVVAKGIRMLMACRLFSLHLPRPGWLRLRAQ